MNALLKAPTLVGEDVDVEASNLLCVPLDAWSLVEPYAHTIVERCRARERLLHGAGQRDAATVVHGLRLKLQRRLGIRS
jgi:hypothetical protein